MKIKLNGSYNNLNVRPEKAEENSAKAAIDIRYTAPLKKEDLHQFVEKDEAQRMNEVFMKNSDKQIGISCIGTFPLDIPEKEHLRCHFDTNLEDGLNLINFKLNSVTLKVSSPGDGLYEISFRLQGNPSKGDIDELVGFVNQSCALQIESMNEDMFDNELQAA